MRFVKTYIASVKQNTNGPHKSPERIVKKTCEEIATQAHYYK
jgi:hypothetical protein